LDQVRHFITKAGKGDPLFTLRLRRHVVRKLSEDEWGTVAHRNKIKAQKLDEQRGKCVYKKCPIPGKKLSAEPVLHRLRKDPLKRYTMENTELLHFECHRQLHAKEGWR
jgi:hypothetical protein